MSNDASARPLAALPAERRAKRRDRVRFSAVIVGENGGNGIDCTIRDLSANGAQVEFSGAFEHAGGVYLLDTYNEMVHLASVVWTDTDRVGLSFLRSYSLKLTLPHRLEFLGRLLIEGKLRDVRALVDRGVPVEEAMCIVGVTADYLARFGKQRDLDEAIHPLLHHAMQLLSK
jgi:PilZ domain